MCESTRYVLISYICDEKKKGPKLQSQAFFFSKSRSGCSFEHILRLGGIERDQERQKWRRITGKGKGKRGFRRKNERDREYRLKQLLQLRPVGRRKQPAAPDAGGPRNGGQAK